MLFIFMRSNVFLKEKERDLRVMAGGAEYHALNHVR